jgi:hypothetical protein
MKKILAIGFFALAITACIKDELIPLATTSVPIPADTSQLGLLSHIGSATLYNSSDAICSITPYPAGDFDSNAIPVGHKVNDFTLYDKDGVGYNLEDKLLEGKAVFIMTGSYTCPVFRNAINELNQLIQSYSNDINFLVAYTVEAHPDIDYSPYSDTVWTTTQNINEGILHEQPETYGERVTVVNALLQQFTINCPVLIDSPCNEFWTTFGEAPNRAYLIDTNGVVQISHGWFNFPVMINNIDTFLAG